jgi:hypothetical protein
MSGSDLREAAKRGDFDLLKEYIVKRSNPCSVDEYGLSSLHYAVWNGHTECVKLLVCNPLGVDVSGKRNKSLELVSCMGYTGRIVLPDKNVGMKPHLSFLFLAFISYIALHLAALDCPKKCARDIAILLFIAGANLTARGDDNKTPLELAQESKNEGFLAAYADFSMAREDQTILATLNDLRNDLNKKYCFQVNAKTRGSVEHFHAPFQLPDFLFTDTKRTGNIPEELLIHEHQIKPMAQTGLKDKIGLDSIHCLAFTLDQALINKQRRERLLEQSDPDFKPVYLKSLMDT